MEATTYTVADVEDAARDQHPGFDEQSTPGRVLRRHLTRKARQLLSESQARNPDPFLCVYEIDLPPADFEEGDPLPAHLYIKPGKVFWTENRESDLSFVSREVLAQPHLSAWPAAAVVSGRIYFGRTDREWLQAVMATVLYVPILEELAGPTSTFEPLTEDALDPLVCEAALFMARRCRVNGAPLDQREYKWLEDELVRSRAAYLDTIQSLRRAVVGKRREGRY